MKILYFGDMSVNCTSYHRSQALKRSGHDVITWDPKSVLHWTRARGIFHFKTGYIFLQNEIVKGFKRSGLMDQNFDLLWVDSGDIVPAKLLCLLSQRIPMAVNYNCDDPTGKRDGLRWLTFKGGISLYDLCVTVRTPTALEYPHFGAKRVLQVFRSADEIAHHPREISAELRNKWSSEVAFVGTWMPERGPLLSRIKASGAKLSIWGGRWEKAPEWRYLEDSWRGRAEGDDYAYAIQCASISLGLLSKGNRDLHTQRSAEIPALGGFLLAERTSEHLTMFPENVAAVYWNDTEECVRQINRYLSDAAALRQVRINAREYWQSSPYRNEVVVQTILKHLYAV